MQPRKVFWLFATARKNQIKEGDQMRFRFNVLLNGFVLVSVAVQSATAEALAHAEILDGRGTKIGDTDITSADQSFQIAVKALNLSPGEYGNRIHPVGLADHQNLDVVNNRIGILNFVADGITLGDKANSLFRERGGSLVIHAKPEDLMSDPPRNSGDPIACTVLQK